MDADHPSTGVLLPRRSTVYGWRAVERDWDLPSLAMEIPLGLPLAAVPIGMGLAGLRTVFGMVEDVAAWRRGQTLAASAARDL